MGGRDAELVQQLTRQAGVERQAVFVLRVRAPLRKAAAQRVRADHAPAALAQVLGQFVHVAPCTSQSMPGNDSRRICATPIHEMDFTPLANHVARYGFHVAPLFCALARKRPTTPVGK